MRTAALLLLLMIQAAGALAVEQRFPPPDFGSGYVYPTTVQSPPRADAWGWVDLGILVAVLTAAAVIIHVKRSRRAMFWLSFFSVLYFGFYRLGCVCPIGAIQNVAQGMFDRSFHVPLIVLAFFAVPLLAALFVGRVFCGGACPLGAVQDLVMIKAVRLPRWLDEGLRTVPYLYLGLAVLLAATGSRYLICEYDPFVSFFRMAARFQLWVWSGALLGLSLFIGRPYCRFLCPYGALLGMFSRFSARRVTITPDRCTNCHLCREACAFGAIRPAAREPNDHQAIEKAGV